MGTLNLAHNEIGDEGVTSVVALLEENPHVTHIDLGHNSISDDGVRALVESLRTSTTLKKVSLTGNAYTADVRGELGKALVVRPSAPRKWLCFFFWGGAWLGCRRIPIATLAGRDLGRSLCVSSGPRPFSAIAV